MFLLRDPEKTQRERDAYEDALDARMKAGPSTAPWPEPPVPTPAEEAMGESCSTGSDRKLAAAFQGDLYEGYANWYRGGSRREEQKEDDAVQNQSLGFQDHGLPPSVPSSFKLGGK